MLVFEAGAGCYGRAEVHAVVKDRNNVGQCLENTGIAVHHFPGND